MEMMGMTHKETVTHLSGMAAEETEDAAKYAHCAVMYKQDKPKLAEMFHTMAQQEMEHMHLLQDAVTKELKAMQEMYEQA